ncbi:MAG: hypothetical protein J6B91_09410 [Prevotella sp.]|nr:hypothetical protein [Prevotella sp.]
MIYGSNTAFNEGSSLDLISAAVLPEVALRTVCIVTSENVTEILMQTKAPDHATGRCWVQIEQYGERNTISNGGGLMFKLGQAWRSNGTDWVPVSAYYSLWSEWVQFSWEFIEVGYEWNYAQASPLLTRTGAAVGLEASAGVGVLAGSSGFDKLPIYRDIVRVNLADDGTINAIEGDEKFKTDGSNGQVMTRIPAFYYKVVNNSDASKLAVSVCNNKHEGYELHPAFKHNNAEQQYIYVGSYKTGAGYTSKAGIAPLTNQTRGATRSGIAGTRGGGWSMVDLATRQAISLLMYIEFGTLDLQTAIAPGVSNSNNTAAVNTGGTDDIAGHTGRCSGTADKVNFRWRYIEDWWGNVWEWIDGLNINGGAFYYCLNQAQFADDTASNYTKLSYSVGTGLSTSYGTRLGYDPAAPWSLLPSAHSGGSSGSYLCDACWSGTGWRVANAGGYWDNALACGPAAWNWDDASSNASAAHGSRLLFIP